MVFFISNNCSIILNIHIIFPEVGIAKKRVKIAGKCRRGKKNEINVTHQKNTKAIRKKGGKL